MFVGENMMQFRKDQNIVILEKSFPMKMDRKIRINAG